MQWQRSRSARSGGTRVASRRAVRSLLLGEPGSSVAEVCAERILESAWSGDAIAFALACQRRLRLREHLVKRLGRDRQRPQGHLIGRGFDQPREMVLGPTGLSLLPRRTWPAAPCGSVIRCSMGDGIGVGQSLASPGSAREALLRVVSDPGGGVSPGDEDLLGEEPSDPASPRLPAAQGTGIPERRPGAATASSAVRPSNWVVPLTSASDGFHCATTASSDTLPTVSSDIAAPIHPRRRWQDGGGSA